MRSNSTPDGELAEVELALIVIRAQLGDLTAFDELFRRVGPKLLGYLKSIVSDEVDPEDLLQEVFLTIYQKIRWLDDPAHFRSWAYRIAARKAFRALRRKRGRAQTQLTDEEWSLVRQQPALMERQLLGDDVLQELTSLPPAGRAVLSLHYLEGLSIDEAAARLGIPLGTAKSRLAYGLQWLRERLGR